MITGWAAALRQGLLVAALGLVLGGCARLHVPPMPADYRFSPEDEWGLVVMGLASAKRPAPEVNFMALFWQRYDVARQTIVPAPAKDVPLVFNRARAFKHDGTDYDTTIVYGGTRVPPGDYVASQIMVQSFVNGKNTQHLTRTYGNQDKPVAANFLASDDELSVANRDVPRFTIRPGEIVYLGDFTIDPTVFPAKIVRITSNPEQARQELANRPNLKGEMRSGLRMKD